MVPEKLAPQAGLVPFAIYRPSRGPAPWIPVGSPYWINGTSPAGSALRDNTGPFPSFVGTAPPSSLSNMLCPCRRLFRCSTPRAKHGKRRNTRQPINSHQESGVAFPDGPPRVSRRLQNGQQHNRGNGMPDSGIGHAPGKNRRNQSAAITTKARAATRSRGNRPLTNRNKPVSARRLNPIRLDRQHPGKNAEALVCRLAQEPRITRVTPRRRLEGCPPVPRCRRGRRWALAIPSARPGKQASQIGDFVCQRAVEHRCSLSVTRE